MRYMTGCLLFVLLLATGACGIYRKGSRIPDHLPVKLDDPEDGRKAMFQYNISSGPFWIKRVDIVWNEKGDEDRYLAYVKMNKEHEWLISLRSASGIEGFRILIQQDSSYVLNRLERKLLHASTADLLQKYGFTYEYLPVIVGDMPEAPFQTVSREQGERESHVHFLTGKNLDLKGTFDGAMGKMTSVESVIRRMGISFTLSYSDFKHYRDRNVPTKIILTIPEKEIYGVFTIKDLLLEDCGNWGWNVKGSYERISLR